MEKVKKENMEMEAEESEEAENDQFEAENEEVKLEDDQLERIQLELSREELLEELNEKEEKIEKMDAEIDDLLSRLQRLQADFVNYRKRSQREKAEMTDRGKIKLCSSLLPVIDNFERALKAEENKNEFYQGVEMIYNQLIKNFAEHDIKEIKAEGEEFDPEYHEAILRVNSDEYEQDVVVEVVQKGFILADHVIRPAVVKVAG